MIGLRHLLFFQAGIFDHDAFRIFRRSICPVNRDLARPGVGFAVVGDLVRCAVALKFSRQCAVIMLGHVAGGNACFGELLRRHRKNIAVRPAYNGLCLRRKHVDQARDRQDAEHSGHILDIVVDFALCIERERQATGGDGIFAHQRIQPHGRIQLHVVVCGVFQCVIQLPARHRVGQIRIGIGVNFLLILRCHRQQGRGDSECTVHINSIIIAVALVVGRERQAAGLDRVLSCAGFQCGRSFHSHIVVCGALQCLVELESCDRVGKRGIGVSIYLCLVLDRHR